jgi:drug/metabolite transporter (DMT)-like permease
LLSIGSIVTIRPMGVLFCLASAACFATLGIFGRLATGAGADVGSLLLVRFGLAGAVFWLLLRAWPRVRRLPRRTALIAFALGALGYSLQSALFFAAIERLDVSLVSLLLYTYPAFVTLAAIATRRARPSLRIGAALGVASAGLVLVLLAAGTGAFDLGGSLLALGASLTYTAYILVSDRIVGVTDPVALTALVLLGATCAFAVAGLITGSVDLRLSAEAWLWLGLIALVSTVLAVSAFFAGLRRVGPSEAAILSTFEPPVTVLLAFLALGERLSATQLAGGVLVLGAVAVLQLPERRPRLASRGARGGHDPLRGQPDPAGAGGSRSG